MEPLGDNADDLSARTYTFATDDNDDVSKPADGNAGTRSSYSYTLRGLMQREVKPWAAFCASIFAYKANPPPPEYFERHYYNDPLHKASLIRVAFAKDDKNSSNNQIVASCRIFERQISDGKGGSILAGGIGEVCTSNNHRRRGLSRELMKDCIGIMTRYGMKASILHAAPTFFPVYRSMGYECTMSKWSLVQVTMPIKVTVDDDDSALVCREATFPEDTAPMMTLHQQFSERQFTGCIVRSEAYWNTYLSVELKGALFVLIDPAATTTKIAEGQSQPLAWLSVRPRGDRWQLREFCYNNASSRSDNSSGCSLSVAMKILLDKALPAGGGPQKLHLPTFLVDQLQSENDTGNDWISWDSLTEENDQGWMYRALGEDGVSLVELSQACPHLIWPADSF